MGDKEVSEAVDRQNYYAAYALLASLGFILSSLVFIFLINFYFVFLPAYLSSLSFRDEPELAEEHEQITTGETFCCLVLTLVLIFLWPSLDLGGVGKLLLAPAIFVFAHLTYESFTARTGPKKVSLTEVDELEGEEFETFTKRLLNEIWDSAKTTPKQDYGTDVIAWKDGKKYSVQCKRYEDNVSNSAVQEAIAGMHHHNCDKAVVITNSNFTKSAKEQARKSGYRLINREKLKSLFSQYKEAGEVSGKRTGVDQVGTTSQNAEFEADDIAKHIMEETSAIPNNEELIRTFLLESSDETPDILAPTEESLLLLRSRDKIDFTKIAQKQSVHEIALNGGEIAFKASNTEVNIEPMKKEPEEVYSEIIDRCDDRSFVLHRKKRMDEVKRT